MKHLLFIAVLLVGYTTQAQNAPASHGDGRQMIHHVYFTLKNPDSVEEQATTQRRDYNRWPLIAEVKHLIIGEPAPYL